MLLQLAAATAAGGFAYFLALWLGMRRQLTSMTAVEFAMAEMADDRARRSKPSLRRRLDAELVARGYRGGIGPILLAAGLGYLIAVAALSVLGFNGVGGVILAIPVTIGAAWAGLARAGSRRRRNFNSQLPQLFSLLAGQLEAGTSLQRALPSVASTLQDPMRSELGLTLAGGATTDLVAAAQDLAERYPSRAMTLFLSALQVDQDLGGGQLAGTLRQLARIVEQERELSEEATGQLSETRSEFIGIVVVLLAIVIFTVSSQLSAFLSPLGLIALSAGAANFAVGVWRALRMFSGISS